MDTFARIVLMLHFLARAHTQRLREALRGRSRARRLADAGYTVMDVLLVIVVVLVIVFLAVLLSRHL